MYNSICEKQRRVDIYGGENYNSASVTFLKCKPHFSIHVVISHGININDYTNKEERFRNYI